MPNAVSKIPLSGSTSGKGIKVVATSTPGTTIHVTGSGSGVIDEMWIYAENQHTSDVVLTLEFGGVTVPDNTIVGKIPFNSGLVLMIPGLPLIETGGALTVGAFAATGNVVTIYGYANKITP